MHKSLLSVGREDIMVDREFGRIQPAHLPPYATETTDSAKEYKYL